MSNAERTISVASLRQDMTTLTLTLATKATRTKQRIVDIDSRLNSLTECLPFLQEAAKAYARALELRWDPSDEDLRLTVESTHTRLSEQLAQVQTAISEAHAARTSTIADAQAIEQVLATDNTPTSFGLPTLASHAVCPPGTATAASPAVEVRPVVDGPQPPSMRTTAAHSSAFLRLCDKLSHAHGSLELHALTDDALSVLDELSDSEVVRVLSRLVSCHQAAGMEISPPLSGVVTDSGLFRHDPQGARTIAELRAQATSRRKYASAINNWITRLEQESLDFESHASLYTPMQIRLLVQKIAFDGKWLCATYADELGLAHRDRLRRQVFGKVKSVKNQFLPDEFIDGLAQAWKADALPVFWETALEDINIKIARAFALMNPEMPRPKAAPENSHRHEDFEASYKVLVKLLEQGAEDSQESSNALPSIIESTVESAKGNPKQMEVLARLLSPYPSLVVGRNLRCLRKVIEESKPDRHEEDPEAESSPATDVARQATHTHPLVVRAKAKLAGKRVVLIGGTRREERARAITQAFELAELEWASVEFKSGRSNIDRIRRQLLEGRYDAAFILIKYTSHAVTDGLSDCRDRCFLVQSGYGPVALAKAVLGKDGGSSTAAA